MQTRLYGIIYRATSPSGKALYRADRAADEISPPSPTRSRQARRGLCRADSSRGDSTSMAKTKCGGKSSHPRGTRRGWNYAETALISPAPILSRPTATILTNGRRQHEKQSEEVRRNNRVWRNQRGMKIPSAETRAKIGAANKGKKRTPETLSQPKRKGENHGDRPRLSSPNAGRRWKRNLPPTPIGGHIGRRKRAAGVKRFWAHIATMKTYWADPARRAARRAGMQALWRDPVYRENVIAARKKARGIENFAKSLI